jgi:hypothetical protein
LPKVAKFKNYTFFVYAHDLLHEPAHVHVAKQKSERQYSAKIWLHDIQVADIGSMTPAEVNIVLRIIKLHRNSFINFIENLKEGKSQRPINLR